MSFQIRHIAPQDLDQWQILWQGYNEFYGRSGPTALPSAITESTWARLLDAQEPVHGLVAERDGQLLGLAHYLFHRSTTRIDNNCYMQDLFTLASARGQGVGRALIEQVYTCAKAAGSLRVYWQTQHHNKPGRILYDKVASHKGFIVYSHEMN